MSTTTMPTSPPDGRRAGATWVAATGAFLLLASAAVFVAVRWDQVPEAAKLALIGALTGAFLAGGRGIRRTLPATGDVLFHLGAFLVLVDVAGLGLRLDLDWRTLLLTEGVVGIGVLGALAVAAGSVVLMWGAAASVMVLAAGIAGLTPVPAPLMLAAAAVAAALLGRHRLAVLWVTGAGLAPVAGALTTAALQTEAGPGTGVLEELGLGGHAAALLAVVSGAAAAFVLAREAARRHDLTLVALAGACLTTSAATTWVNASPPEEVSLLAGPALLLLIEAVAILCHRDTFWGRPAGAAGLLAELVAVVVAAPVAAVLLLVAPFVDGAFDLFSDGAGWTPEPAAGLAFALLAGGALLAAWRRQGLSGHALNALLPSVRSGHGAQGPGGSGWTPSGPTSPPEWGTHNPGGAVPWGTPISGRPSDPATQLPGASPLAALGLAVGDDRTVTFLAAAVGAALVVGTGSTIAVAAGLVALAAGLILVVATLPGSKGVMATVLGVAAAVWAPVVTAASHPLVSLPVGLSAAAVLGGAALAWRHVAGGWVSVELAVAGSFVAFFGCAVATGAGAISLTAAMLIAVAAAWALAALLERASPLAAHLVRATMAVGVAGAMSGTSAQILPVAAAATLLFALDAVRQDEPLIGLGSALGFPVVVGAAAALAGLAAPSIGLVLCLSALVCGGLALGVPTRWRLPFVAAAAVGLAAGLALAAGEPVRLAECLLVGGGLAAGAGVVTRNGILGHAGGAMALTGLGLNLTVVGVRATEAFVAPVALQLVVAGWQLRRRVDPPSSWVAFGPAIGLLGAAALAERLSGAEAWHSLIAGAVGVVAVAVGGWRRLAGPLFLGTGLLVAVTVLESLTTLAGIPTWGWLAVGGSILLAAGVAMERSATTPVEAGRRLVDVVEERFS